MGVLRHIVETLSGEAGNAAVQRCAYSFCYLISNRGLSAEAEVPLAVVGDFLIRCDELGFGGYGTYLRADVQRPPAIRGRDKAKQVCVGLKGELAPARAVLNVVVVPSGLAKHGAQIAHIVLRQPVRAAVQGRLFLAAQLEPRLQREQAVEAVAAGHTALKPPVLLLFRYTAERALPERCADPGSNVPGMLHRLKRLGTGSLGRKDQQHQKEYFFYTHVIIEYVYFFTQPSKIPIFKEFTNINYSK